jgi:heat shock protein HtpX
MTETRRDLPSYPAWPTVLIMVLLATVGAFVWGMLSLVGSVAAVASSGPFGWIVYGPMVTAGFTTAFTLGSVAVPLWALLGGQMFAAAASGRTGRAAADMGVTLFSETHPIAKVTQRLAEMMGLPPVRYIGWFPGDDINAFAMGNTRANAMVAMSKGAVERLTKAELIAVIAHELGHIASNDMARMTQARGVQEALTFLLVFRGLKQFARWVFTPLSELELLRLSRAREFTADRIAAIMVGPAPMIAALQKLQEETLPVQSRGYANVLMRSGFSGGGLLSTHPPLSTRISRLEGMLRTREATEAQPVAAPAQ